jgi:hypothetical protein
MLRSASRWLLVLASLGATACGPASPAEDPSNQIHDDQSYAAALRMFCQVDQLSGANPEDPLELAQRREDYLVEHVRNPDGQYFLTIWRTKGPAERAAMLEKELATTQISPCPLVATLRAEEGTE